MARTARNFICNTALLLGTLALASLALAQQKPSAAPPPPQLERIDQGSDTPVTITPQKSNKNKISQTKDGGRVKEVQVSAGGSNYTMKGVQPGSAADMNSQNGSSLHPPQWKVLEFGKRKKTDPEAAGADTTVNAPPPQTVK